MSMKSKISRRILGIYVVVAIGIAAVACTTPGGGASTQSASPYAPASAPASAAPSASSSKGGY
jgi:hypothetical protein